MEAKSAGTIYINKIMLLFFLQLMRHSLLRVLPSESEDLTKVKGPTSLV